MNLAPGAPPLNVEPFATFRVGIFQSPRHVSILGIAIPQTIILFRDSENIDYLL
jgi:hypothetical protein